MNCNDTLTYAKELKRMCAAYHICDGCPLQHDRNCLHATSIDSAHVKVVQEWSDSHSDSLLKERFIKDFKDYWGSDVQEEDLGLYLSLLEWIRNEFEKI